MFFAFTIAPRFKLYFTDITRRETFAEIVAIPLRGNI